MRTTQTTNSLHDFDTFKVKSYFKDAISSPTYNSIRKEL